VISRAGYHTRRDAVDTVIDPTVGASKKRRAGHRTRRIGSMMCDVQCGIGERFRVSGFRCQERTVINRP
jgi:hypothetical protein